MGFETSHHQLQTAIRPMTDSAARLKRICQFSDEVLSLNPRECQIRAAHGLIDGQLVEMETGEGKTLSIALAAAALVQRGHRVRIATANDYLAQRDADWMRPLYAEMGQACEVALGQKSSGHADVCYGTLRQFAFEFLRSRTDNAGSLNSDHEQFGFDVLIIDEADSLLIDEARMPMVIHGASDAIDKQTEANFRWAAPQAAEYDENDFVIDASRQVALTDAGQRRFFAASIPPELNSLTTTDLQHAVERAIYVRRTLQPEEHYLLAGDRIVLVDEFTGRATPERSFGGGIQQAIEAQHNLQISTPSHPVARITTQDFCMNFRHRCGITATASDECAELQSVYGLKVTRVDPFRASQLKVLDPIACRDHDEKIERICDEAQATFREGRPVLIGTRTVHESELIHDRLLGMRIESSVLNARQDADEAKIIARAGQTAVITVATNMAGRGTDIPVSDTVRSAGGLHVIVSEMNSVARIDKQLIGRCARQGAPGSARIFVSPDDFVFTQSFNDSQLEKIRRLPPNRLFAKAQAAQKKLSQRFRMDRIQMAAQERELGDAMKTLGLDPCMDLIADPI